MSFALSSQITTYCVAATVFTQQEVNNADIFGLAIPLPKSYEFGGFVREPVSRRDYHYERWVKWLVHTISLARQYKDDPYNSPRYTHSCSRYFRPCAFISFCDADDEEQHSIINEMPVSEWTPLAKPIIEDTGVE